ncbi:MAG: prolipoprotein diacylglyceryl transferase [Clostridiales bacterium]|nr:prolipoprotein diacylglyceryl transferase [Clostridiales bacterium]
MTTFFNTYIPNPVAFSIFGLNIMWYGVLIGAGILLAAVVAYSRAPKHGLQPDKLLDVLIVSLPAGIIGARVYYVAFNWGDYSGDILKMINIRLGGLAIHGGLIAGILMCIIICRARKVNLLSVLDTCAPSIALAQAIGRWGNYFNSEAHGGPTGLPWGIPVNGQMVHPTFLYESVWCLMLFFVLVFIDNRRNFDGQTIFCYGMLYSVERFFVEILRTDSLMVGMFKQAQVMSIVVFAICLAALIVLGRTARTRGNIFYN